MNKFFPLKPLKDHGKKRGRCFYGASQALRCVALDLMSVAIVAHDLARYVAPFDTDHQRSLRSGTHQQRSQGPGMSCSKSIDEVIRQKPAPPRSEGEQDWHRVKDKTESSTRKGPSSAKPKDALAAHSVAALMLEEFPPTRWIVSGLLPQGTLLLAGKPKSGKSWFALSLFVACKLHDHFLRCQVERCDGLYLALEDTSRRMQNRMRTLMADCMNRIDELHGFEYRCHWPKGADGAAELDRYLTTHSSCRVVAVDVLARIRPAGDKRGAYEQDYEAIATWKTVADKHGILLLIVHHTRKAEAGDVFDEVSGTLAINGAVDQILVLKRLASDPKRATLHMRGRDLEEDQALGLELRGGWWCYIGSAASISMKAERMTITDILRDAPGSMSVTEILKATGKKSRPSLSRLLASMVQDGQIQREGSRFVLSVAD